jgi:parvulin-like peptidyl-prolyl isomerase
MTNPRAALLSAAEMDQLVRRMDLLPQLLRRQEEEAIVALVPLPQEWLHEQRSQILGEQSLESWLDARGWLESDLDLHLRRPEALQRFAKQRFGPGLEERFLASKGGRDEVIYSLLRVRDSGLARELWIRLEEEETTFAEAARHYSEGPEAQRKGVMGPMPIGVLQPPQLADWLRTLQPGELLPPRSLGEWQVLLRLEQLSPARFDGPMCDKLLEEELDAFLQARVQQRLSGEKPDPLHYDHDL